MPSDGIASSGGEFDFSLITGESAGVWMEPGSLIGTGAFAPEKIILMVPKWAFNL